MIGKYATFLYVISSIVERALISLEIQNFLYNSKGTLVRMKISPTPW